MICSIDDCCLDQTVRNIALEIVLHDQQVVRCKTERQNYLDAVGAGQTCGEVALTSKIENGMASFEVQIDSIRFYGSMKNGKLTYVERDYS